MGAMSSDEPELAPVTIELRQRFPLFVLGFLLAAAILLPDRAWNTLLVGLGGLYLLAYSWTRWLIHNLHAERRLRFNWVAVGDRLEEQFALVNRSPVPALWVEVSDESNVPGYTAAVVRSAAQAEFAMINDRAIRGDELFPLDCELTLDVIHRTLSFDTEIVWGKMTGAELTRIVEQYTNPADGDTVLLWMMDEGYGSTASDESGNGHDGTVEGATWAAISSCDAIGAR